jgi:hypothetical protein
LSYLALVAAGVLAVVSLAVPVGAATAVVALTGVGLAGLAGALLVVDALLAPRQDQTPFTARIAA